MEQFSEFAFLLNHSLFLKRYSNLIANLLAKFPRFICQVKMVPNHLSKNAQRQLISLYLHRQIYDLLVRKGPEMIHLDR